MNIQAQFSGKAPDDSPGTDDAEDLHRLSRRLEFLSLDADAWKALQAAGVIIDRELKPVLDRLYDRIEASPELSRFFRDKSHMEMAKSAQFRHWQRFTKSKP